MTSERPTAYPSAIENAYRPDGFGRPGLTPLSDLRAARAEARAAWCTAAEAEHAAHLDYEAERTLDTAIAHATKAALRVADLAWAAADGAVRVAQRVMP